MERKFRTIRRPGNIALVVGLMVFSKTAFAQGGDEAVASAVNTVWVLMAGIDGIQKRIDPGEPADFDLYELPPAEAAKINQVPDSLSEALNALEADHEFLLKGGVFTPDLIETWIKLKREREVDPIRLRPHPYEFYLYYDA